MLKRLDPRTKIFLVLAISLLAVTLDQALSLAALAGISFLLFLLSRPSRFHLKGALLMAALTTWGLIVSQGLFYQNFPRTVLFYVIPPFKLLGRDFCGLAIYRQGLYYGAVQALRFLAGMFAGLSLCISTPVERLFLALSRLPIPQGLSFLSVSAIRFLPVVADELRRVRQALRLKGYQPLACGLFESIRTELSVVLPVLSGAIRRSQDLADALLTRGFNPLALKSQDLPWPSWEKLTSLLFLLTALVALGIKLLFWLYLQEVLYLEGLRGLYAFARHWL